MKTKAVKLNNGTEEYDMLVKATMLQLKALCSNEPVAFYEFVERCRDDQHQFFGDCEKRIQKFNLMQSLGVIHKSIKNITLAATKGEGLELVLIDPIKREEEKTK